LSHRVSGTARQIVLAGSALFILSFALSRPAFAQTSPAEGMQLAALPNAPEPIQAASQAADNQAGNISGTVVDTSGDVLQGATITLTGPPGFAVRTLKSGSDGQFGFANLPPGSYTITAAGDGMSKYKSSPIELKPGEFRIVHRISLSVSGGATSVTVTANNEELSEQQVQIAVQQRVAGVIPNFYSSFDWNAPPMMAKQKYHLVFRSLIDPVSFLAVAGIAGAEQYKGIFPAYGSGIEGYGKRYGAALANRVSGDLLGRAVYPAIFHQDPRYFYKGKGSVTSRALYAIEASVMARSDSGRWEPNYSQVLGNFSAGAISMLYYPQSDRGASLVLLNGLADTGADAVSNLFREFVLKGITSHVPKGATGQP
jgi:hypothetical protein